MMTYAIITLGSIGAVGALILYLASVKFHVDEDPRIAAISEILPGANCGGCGFPGCSGFAVACVKVDSLDGLTCPAGGSELMHQIAEILGKQANIQEQQIAVIRCKGSYDVRPRICHYDGAKNCAIIAMQYVGETDCLDGCFGFGDCVDACTFNAIRINPVTQLAEVNEETCTACGACVKVCPKRIIKLRKKGPKSRRIFVSCVNRSKGSVARKACASACIGCGICSKVCAFEAITLKSNKAYIDDTKCRLCRKCVSLCPTGAIVEVNFPPRKTPPNIDNA